MAYRTWLFLAVLVCVLSGVCRADPSTYSQIAPSLALVVREDPDGPAFGTAFCVDHDRGYGVYLTNAHVAGSGDRKLWLAFADDKKNIYPAALVRTANSDAAVLLAKRDCPPLTLSNENPAVGTSIAIAGFPAMQLLMLARGQGLTPSFHVGTVSALSGDGTTIEYDAMTDHGNSGSPLVDAATGVVYGLVQLVNTGTTGALQNNLAIGAPTLSAFLQNAHRDVAAVVETRPSGEASAASDVASSTASAQPSAQIQQLGDDAAAQAKQCFAVMKSASASWQQLKSSCIAGVDKASALEKAAPANSEAFLAGELAEGACGGFAAVAMAKLGDRANAQPLAHRSLVLIDDVSSRTTNQEIYDGAQQSMTLLLAVFKNVSLP